MCIKLFLLGIFLFTFIKLSAQNDGLSLNMRLYPVQILSIDSDVDLQKNHQYHQETGTHNKKYFSVSSTTGFEVNMYNLTDDHNQLNITSSSRGAAQKILPINKSMENQISRLHPAGTLKSDYLVLTLISQ